MKRLIVAFLMSMGVFVLLPVTSLAATSYTDISGVVTNNGQPVPGAKVTVICNNNSKTDITDSTGTYLVQYNAVKCPTGSTTSVFATKSGKGGESTGNVNSATDRLNVAIVNVALPEFGLIAGTSAALLGGGAFMIIRRRQLSGHEA